MTGTLMAFVEGILRATASQSAEPALAEVFQTVRSQKDAWPQLVGAGNSRKLTGSTVPVRQICRWHRAQAPNQTMHSSKNPSPDNNSEDSCGGISVAFVPFPLNSSISGETPGNFASMEQPGISAGWLPARKWWRLPYQKSIEGTLYSKAWAVMDHNAISYN